MLGEIRRAAAAMNVMSRAIGESGERAKRVDQLEDDVAELMMRLEELKERHR